VLVFVGVLGASMSTANGAMLVIAVVMARNLWQRSQNRKVSDSTMLLLSRALALPTAAAAGWLAWVRPEPGVLLIVAFDIVFAGCVVPLFFGVYWKRANSAGAIAAILTGTVARAACYGLVPPHLAGLDTLLPPVLSLVAFLGVCWLAQDAADALRHAALLESPSSDLLTEAAEG
jgi:Na+/proline symporter